MHIYRCIYILWQHILIHFHYINWPRYSSECHTMDSTEEISCVELVSAWGRVNNDSFLFWMNCSFNKCVYGCVCVRLKAKEARTAHDERRIGRLTCIWLGRMPRTYCWVLFPRGVCVFLCLYQHFNLPATLQSEPQIQDIIIYYHPKHVSQHSILIRKWLTFLCPE